MDVRCERCGTEYEFDDALVSGRGTTVKCTNCGHKFKIRRSDGDYAEDFWNVRTGDGRTLVFTSLRELQRAIQAHQVERSDMLSRGGLPPKAIGGIPELTPFFDQREARDTIRDKGGTLPPAAPRLDGREAGRSRPPPPPGAAAPALAPPRQRSSTKPEFPPPPAVLGSAATRTLPGTGEAPAPTVDPRRTQPIPTSMRGQQSTLPGVAPPTEGGAARASVPPPLPARARSVAPPPPKRSSPPAAAPPAPLEPPRASAPEVRAASERPPVPSAPSVPSAASARPSSRLQEPATPPAVEPPASRAVAPAAGEDRTSPLPPLRRVVMDDDDARASRPSMPPRERSRPVGGYVVALVVLVGVGMLGTIWARDNLGKIGGSKPAPTAPVDPRIASFLGTGEQALAEGNLELAKESFDKASVVAEKDPRVLLGFARLASARADVEWLKDRLLPADAADEHRVTRERLGELAQTARRAADGALAVAPDDASALRAKVDALRLSGDGAGARALVARVGSATQPESAYVLAALDLAEAEPLWPSVVERLRTAAGSEGGPGRARAALVYALARSGDVAAARTELDRLAAMPRQHPLVPQLRGFVERTRPVAALAPHAPNAIDAGAPGAKPAAGGAPAPGGGGGGDPRQLVAQAEAARAKGEYEKARGLYASAVDRNPSDSEALHGLASIQHAQRDLAGAKASYRRVLAINPSYLPSLLGLADVDWESGDRASALKAYKEIVDRFPAGMYPARVQQRLEPASGGGEKPTPSPAPTATESTGGGG